MTENLEKAHRLLAPRVSYLIGTRAKENRSPNMIPVSNLTSISTNPQQIMIAVYKEWRTCRNLSSAQGFTVSVPHIDQLGGVWKLGARYSHYPSDDTAEKIASCGLSINHTSSPYGPVLADGVGWMACRILARLDFDGDHGVFVAQLEHASFNPKYLHPDGTPKDGARPVMQVTGNLFTTPSAVQEIPYYGR